MLLGFEYFLSRVREVFSHYLFKYFLKSFLSLVSFCDHYSTSVGEFNVVPKVSFFIVFSIFSLYFVLQ